MHFGQYDLTMASPGISDKPELKMREMVLKIDSGVGIRFGLTQWKHRLALAVDARTMSKVAALVFLNHLGDTTIGQDVPGVDQTVKHLGRLLNKIGLVGIVVQLVLY